MKILNKIFVKTIRFENFKSYSGQNEAGPCHPGLNSIIGSNGSGKSNFLDAIIFVLGKKATEIRFRYLSDVISFSRFKKYKIASVSISFRSDLFSVKNEAPMISEMAVTRKVFKVNSSVYFFNGKELSFQFLTKIFSDKGIFLKNNRFIIQQGEIEKISSMKPLGKTFDEIGLLEYSEEVFGTFRYIKSLNLRRKKKEFFQTKKENQKRLDSKKLSFENGKKSFFRKILILEKVLYTFHLTTLQNFSVKLLFYQKKKKVFL